jgi:hypothetical protein
VSTEIVIVMSFRPDGRRVNREVWVVVDGVELSEADGLPKPLLLPTKLPQEWLPRGAAIGRSDASLAARRRLAAAQHEAAGLAPGADSELEGQEPQFHVGSNGDCAGS